MKTKSSNKIAFAHSFHALFLVLIMLGLVSGCHVVKTNFSSEAKKKATVYYYLPESIIKIRATTKVAVTYGADSNLTGSSNIIEQSFTVATEVIADTKYLLSLKYKANPLMADEIKYTVNAKGLLETVNVTSDDRTTDIISRITEAPQVVLGSNTSDEKKAVDNIVLIKEFVSDFAVKASSVSNVDFPINWNLVIVNELGKKQQPQVVKADFILSSEEGSTTAPVLSTLINGDTNNKNDEVNGILTRPIKNISLKIKSAQTEANFNNTLPTNIIVADVSKLIVVEVKRTAFVKRVNKIGIQDGIILSNEINKPSSVEGFVSIPINIAKAIVSIPGQLVQFKFDNTKRANELEKAMLEYEKSIQASQKFALTKEQELEKVKLEIEKNALSNSIELQKLKLDLQTQLLTAEKQQLEAQKALNEIKKLLEELKQKK